GSDQVVIEDVREIEQAIGVNLKGDNENMLSVLTRQTKKRRRRQ
ncbi:hypothetical protein A2U01_0074775, partial [Trifolium medium]|nr:hypothetical protein [Trifolium medium]